MTLLSIREQEAVKEALDNLVRAVEREYRDDDITEVRSNEAKAALLNVVILATRDAIARQVRELATKELYAAGEEAVLHAATFIEGLEP